MCVAQPISDLTTPSCARSNTALFRTGGNGNEADVSTFQDAACAAPRLSGAQPHTRGTGGSTPAPRRRPAAPRVVAAGGKRFGLDPGRRLRRKADFERLLRQGARRTFSGYIFYLERRGAGGPRLGMLVSRKHAAAATERNRIKRCIREAFRMEQEKLGALDLLVRPPYGIKGSADMIKQLRDLLRSLTR
jgi:ribonuclease P protein component